MKQQVTYNKEIESWEDINLVKASLYEYIKERLEKDGRKIEEEIISYDDDVFNLILFWLVNHSKIKANKQLEKFIIKCYFHYDWKTLIKNEIDKKINKVIKLSENVLYSNDFYYFLMNSNQKYNFEESEPIPYKDLKDALSKNSFTRFVYDSIIYDLYSNLSIEVIETNSLIEKYLVKSKKADNEQINLILPDIEILQEYYPNFNYLVKYFSNVYYITTIKTLLDKKSFNIKDFKKTFKVDYTKPIKSNDENLMIGDKPIKTYKLKVKNEILEKIFYNAKNKFLDTNFNQFKDIFSEKNVNEIKPIKSKFNASELIYFIDKLMIEKIIENEKNLNLERLKACFLKKDGIGYTESLSSLRSQLKNDDYNSTYRLLSNEKRAEIDEIIKSK